MRLVRFISDDGKIYLGEENKEFGCVARVVEGSIYNVDTLRRTGEYRYIAILLSPIVPRDIFCIGLNYMRHYEELSKKIGIKLPGRPVVFMKSTSSLNRHGGNISLPILGEEGNEQLDYEVELCVVISKPAKNVSAENAFEYIAGYTVANDVSQRYWQNNAGAGQWIKGKSFDGFSPLGPVFVTRDEVKNPQNLRCISRVNGEIRQDSNTADMIFTIGQCIEWVTKGMTLLPGTVILTGTPEGVGAGFSPQKFLKRGDVVTCEVEGIGELRNQIV